jgi:hypothetical protein
MATYFTPENFQGILYYDDIWYRGLYLNPLNEFNFGPSSFDITQWLSIICSKALAKSQDRDHENFGNRIYTFYHRSKK